MLEIERSFLVNVDKLPTLPRGRVITQGYVYESIPLVRIRIIEQYAYITFKGPGLFVRNEIEDQINIDKATKILNLWCPDQIRKIRYKIGRWEVDQFQGALDGLWLAEIELTDKEEKVELPDWVAKEVTNNPAYTNVVLAKNGKPRSFSNI